MTVVDASAVLELLLRTDASPWVQERLFAGSPTWHAPHLIDLEVAQVLRRYVVGGALDAEHAREALDDLAALPLLRYPHEPFVGRIWELRHTLTAYDGAYVALAEALEATLVTTDRRLARAGGHRARIEAV